MSRNNESNFWSSLVKMNPWNCTKLHCPLFLWCMAWYPDALSHQKTPLHCLERRTWGQISILTAPSWSTPFFLKGKHTKTQAITLESQAIREEKCDCFFLVFHISVHYTSGVKRPHPEDVSCWSIFLRTPARPQIHRTQVFSFLFFSFFSSTMPP